MIDSQIAWVLFHACWRTRVDGGRVSKTSVKVKGGSAKIKHGISYIAPAPPPDK